MKVPCPGNGIFVVQGEISILITALRRGARWSSHSQQDEKLDTLIRNFTDIKDVLNQLGDLRDLDPNHFLAPFLEVIRSEETTGPITCLALSSVNKFLSYGLIDPCGKSVPSAVENIADAVTHARFVGTDHASDAIVLMKILQVLRTLMLSPEGAFLVDDSVCEILMSFFRVCFESRLSELLKKSAEHYLKDMVQFLFSRLPEFSEDDRISLNKKLQMRTGAIESSHNKRKNRNTARPKSNRQIPKPGENNSKVSREKSVAEQDGDIDPSRRHSYNAVDINSDLHMDPSSSETGGNIVDMQGAIHQDSLNPCYDSQDDSLGNTQTNAETPTDVAKLEETPLLLDSEINSCVINLDAECYEREISDASVLQSENCSIDRVILGNTDELEKDMEVKPSEIDTTDNIKETNETAESPLVADDLENRVEDNNTINSPLVEEDRTEVSSEAKDYINPRGVRFMYQKLGQDAQPVVPYGVMCIRELFWFLITLCNPLDKQNNEVMIHMGLTLLTVALEIGADSIGKYNSLLSLVKDDLCRNLFSLLNTERLSIFAADLQVSFLLFESMRTHLKFQLELYLTKLMEIIVSTSPKLPYEQKEIALESIVQLWRIPGLVTELYLNYDCDIHSPNLFEDLTKLLSKNAFPVSGLYSTHLLSLDALLTITDAIEGHCHSRILNEKQEAKSYDEAGENSSSQANIVTHLQHYGVYIAKSGRQKISDNIPTHEQLMAIKHKKKLLQSGTEQFNAKPKKGIQFLQDHHLLSSSLDPQEVVHFLRENPRLDKKMIGEYISNRSNLKVLDAFVKSFDFTDTRIDEALRLYLETFRLPGESPLISLIMEHFAEHWHKCNGEPFANADAAFTLAYAVIMLNVDQHNYNVKRQNNPMTVEEFKRNLKKVNGGEDFDQEMLDDIYTSIKSEEIVMPAEQTGLVRENYLWKVLLRRGASKDGAFIHAPNGLFDHDLFSLIWGPTVAALSYIFDKSNDVTIYQKAISGFRKCSMISAHYGMSNDFDSLVISLCKFTMLLNSAETPDNLTISFGANPKAQLAAKTVFNLAHRHGDILREGWKNVLDCILQLYKCKLLPKFLTEAEDFIDPSGKISLIREETPLQKTETGILSSLYSYIALASEPSNQKALSSEDQEHIRVAHACIKDCHLEQLITESKFLRIDSLQELVKALIFASHGPEGQASMGTTTFDEDISIFFLELLLKVVVQNRDRANVIWQAVRDHIYSILMSAAACDHYFLMERSVVGLLRLATRLMRREDMSPIILQSLRMLLLLKSTTLFRVSRQIAFGLYELLKTSAANIHTDTDWSIIFTLLECVGAGAQPPKVVGDNSKSSNEQTAKSDGEIGHEDDSGIGNDRGYTSDSELSRLTNRHLESPSARSVSPELSPNSGGGWIMVGREGEIQPLQFRTLPINQFTIVHERELLAHDPFALVKCCESLAFLVRDVAHITPYNFEYCVHCIRTFVEASLHGTEKRSQKRSTGSTKEVKSRRKVTARRKEESHRSRSPPNSITAYDADESDSDELPSGYHQVSIQLLDLMHTLHTRTAHIFRWWAEENADTDFTSLWGQGWCPLLQGIARLCCDSRRPVRTSAITYLQRALLVHDLQMLSAQEWEACFNKVLFPLLVKLLDPVNPQDQAGVEETRMRAATVLSKVFLHHLTPLQSLPTFTALWLTILDFMDRYMNADKSDLLYEAIPESLKNMLLVMDSAGVFSNSTGYSQLWTITWDRINTFLPTLRDELFKAHPTVEAHSKLASGNVNESIEPNVQASHEVVSSSAVFPQAQIDPISEVANRPSSIILQPPHPARSVSTPIFTHMGQQILSTPIGAPINFPQTSASDSCMAYSPSNSSVVNSSHGAQALPVFIPTSQPVTPVPLYSTYNTTAETTSGSVTMTIPPHYFYQDVSQEAQQSQFNIPCQQPVIGPTVQQNVFLMNSGIMEGLPIISPPTRQDNQNLQ